MSGATVKPLTPEMPLDPQGRPYPRHRRSKEDVQKLAYVLDQIAREAEKRSSTGDVEFARIATKARAAAEDIAEALYRVAAADAETRRAAINLNRAVPTADDAFHELRGYLYSRFGLRSVELAEFGIAPKRERGRRRSPAADLPS